jgi:hypothetical protein
MIITNDLSDCDLHSRRAQRIRGQRRIHRRTREVRTFIQTSSYEYYGQTKIQYDEQIQMLNRIVFLNIMSRDLLVQPSAFPPVSSLKPRRTPFHYSPNSSLPYGSSTSSATASAKSRALAGWQLMRRNGLHPAAIFSLD